MKKSKKLLSVLLAMLMILSSMSIMASAAKTQYQTVDNLNNLGAYSPYYAVTRLSTEERLSITCDFLDNVLEAANINLGTVIDTMGITLTIDLRSVNALCETLDQVKSVKSNGLVKAIQWMLGIIKDLNISSWEYNVDRDNGGDNNQYPESHKALVNNLLHVISDNAGLITNIVRTGEVDLGVASSALSGLDLSVVKDIPKLVKGLIFPLFERWDDPMARINELENTAGNGGMQSVLNSFVKGLFTKPMSITSYKEDAAGNCISNHALPASGDDSRNYYTKSADGTYIQAAYYDTDKNAYVTNSEYEKYYKTEELDADGKGTGEYVFVATDKNGNKSNLKYYEQGSYFLPSMQEGVDNGSINIDLNENSAASLLYTFAPYVFAEMAPVVLNGSVKKIIAEWFGAEFTYVGEKDSAEVTALADSSNEFFAKEQGAYLWEWSDYAVINGNHYYRFEDSFYKSDLSNTNPYFNIVKWDYKIEGNFIDEFIPGADGNTASAAGYTTVLQALNKFLVKFANTVLTTDTVAKMNLDDGDNSVLVGNLKNAARTIVGISPESLFGDSTENVEYYDLMMNETSTDQEVLVGLACTIVDAIMPQMILPKAETVKGQEVGAVLAAVIREIATQLVPDINYDALIYDNYNTKTFISGKDNSYWLDVCLTIGTDIGFKYLTALADMGEDIDVFAGANWSISKTYTTDDIAVVAGEGDAVKLWEQRVDYIIDWALSTQYEWCWSFSRLVNCGDTIDLSTAQDPWVKLGNIFKSILPITDVFNIDTTSATWLETLLRDNFVLALLNLDVTKIVGGASADGIINIPTTSILRQKNLFTQVTTVVRNLLNNILKVVAKGDLFSATVFTNFDAVLNQTNICDFVELLLQKLYVAYNNGLLEPILPFLNFFVGWTTNAQKYAEPALIMNNMVTVDTSQSNTFSTTLTVRNDSAGMLLKHRNSDVTDNAYLLVIDGISSDYAVSSEFPVTVQPYAKATFTFTRDYSADEVTETTVTYHIERNGKQIGKSKEMSVYQFITNKTSDILGSYSDSQSKNGTGWGVGYNVVKYEGKATTNAVVTSRNGLSSALSNMAVTWTNTRDTACKITESTFTPGSNYVVSSGDAEVYNNTGKWIGAAGSDADDIEITIKPAALNPNTDVESIPSGSTFAIGSTKITIYGEYKSYSNSGSLTCDLGKVYYCDLTDLSSLINDERGAQRIKGNYTADTWATYVAALKDAILFADAPKMAGTFTSTYTDANIEAKYNALKNAVDGLVEVSSSDIDISGLQTALATAEPGGDVPEINYQDYELYEYFEYQDERTATRNTLKSYNKPEEPKSYIEGSSLSEDEINAVVAAETNTLKADAIKATVIAPTDKDIENWNNAIADWKAPSNTQASLDNQAQNLLYYKQFLIAKTTTKQFLESELAYAAAQNYVAADYSADSWANYQTALANANAVNDNANALQSQVFDAKYELMKAQNQLVLATRSAKETGVYAELEALIAKAEDIFANPDNYNVVEGKTAADAYKELMVALGYKYTNAGSEGILYSRSAYDYVTYDRETTLNNVKKVDAAEVKLQAAINNFAAIAAELPEIVANAGTTGVVNAEKHYLYGIAPKTTDITAAFGATHEGSLRLKAGYDKIGTGTEIELLDSTGTVVDNFTVIIFGDLNGDGEITFVDSTMADQYAGGTTSAITGVALTAVDVNADGRVTYVDSTQVDQCAGGTTSAVSQTVGVYAG